MLRLSVAALVLAALLSPGSARAAEQTIALDVENATCDLCAPIIKKTLARVSGVKAVKVAEATSNSNAVATVTFEDSAANVSQLIAAVVNAGYPAHLKN
ncbi:MAG TPA: cation transporter [Stellaceae bacterium]|nr:cation transporter [Stellaceae bacterium]